MNRDPTAWLLATAGLLLGYAIHIGGGGPHPISFVLLGAAVIAAAVGVARLGPPRAPTSVDRLLLFGLAAELALMLVMPIGSYLIGVTPADHAVFIGGVVAAMLVSLWVLRSPHVAWSAFALVVAIHLGLGIWVIGHSPDPFIDVWHFQQVGVDALVSGRNPYLPIYDDIYDGRSPYYGPGIAEGGRLTVGFPYPPLSLLLTAPGRILFGDHRFSQLIALELAAVLMVLTRPNRTSATAALCLLFMPRTLLVAERGFTEPFGALLLAVVAYASVHAPRLLAVAVGLFIAVKQYLLVGLPLAILLLRRSTTGRVRLALVATSIAAIVTLPLALWDLNAFLNSTVQFLLAQPFRPDSLTFSTLLPNVLERHATVVAFAALLAAAGLVVARTHRSPAGYLGGVAFVLLVFFAFGKQGAINYYFLVIACLFVAVTLYAGQTELSERNAPSLV